MTLTVAAFSGSLRQDSYNTKLARAFQKLAPADVTMRLVDISASPLMNEVLEKDLPDSVKDLHRNIEEANAVLLMTPEYNRSYSPALKKGAGLGVAAAGQEQMERKTRGGRRLHAICAGRFRRAAPSAAGVGISEHAGAATARILSGAGGGEIRRDGRVDRCGYAQTHRAALVGVRPVDQKGQVNRSRVA